MEDKPNYIPALIIGIFVVIVVVVGGLFNYKKETLVCNRAEDICKVERTNLFNMKSEKKLAKYSDIAGVSYYRQRIKGNRYSKGYKEYLLVFDLKNQDQVKIFSTSYYEKSELDGAIKDIRSNMRSQNDEFSYSRQ
jgi:hypothetical protein